MVDINAILEKTQVVDAIPKTAHRGKPKTNWQPLIDTVLAKGILKISEKDVNINTTVVSLKRYCKNNNIDLGFATRKINGETFLFISKPFKNKFKK